MPPLADLLRPALAALRQAAVVFGVGLAALAVLAAPAAAQPVRADHVEAELVAAVDAAVPGQPLPVALRLRHEPHWHTYWQVPGDSGLPTRIEWKLQPGWSAGPIEWPLPLRLPFGPLMNFGYEGEVLLLTTLQVPAAARVGDLAFIDARADWLVCKDICIPGGADLRLRLPIRAAAQPGPLAARFAATRALVPQPLALEAAAATIQDGRIRLAFRPAAPLQSLQFFPLEELRIEPAAPQPLRSEQGAAALYLSAALPVAPDFKTLRGVLVANGGPARGGWAGAVAVPLAAGTVPVVAATAAAAPPADRSGGAAAGPGLGLGLALLGALLGGLILNLMPCVFPILSLKLLALLQHQREPGGGGPPLPAHGLAFTAGVLLCFLLLAAALLALRVGGAQLGWGFQLQTPWVVAALTVLFFAIGLNLLGVFEFTLGAGGAGRGPARDTVAGSFWTGTLAVVVAAPCTAPFMGAALGYAVTQPAPVALAVFAVLGLGMALPYLLLTLFPRLLARLPRPGPWMVRLRQILAFPMFLTCVWLLWVLAQQVGVDALALLLVALVLLAAAAWALGLAQLGSTRFRWLSAAAAAGALWAVLAGLAPGGEAPPGAAGRAAAPAPATGAAPTAGAWAAWTPDEVAAHLAAGRPVFVDFTAAWCVTCQANKRLVLTRTPVMEAFAARGVATLRADWTRRDAAITEELARFGRNGVPLYVLYSPQAAPRVLPELLTEGIVLDALATL